MNEEYKFREGDRVYAVYDNPAGNETIKNGYTGTVVQARYFDSVGVRWDEKIIDGHSINGSCDAGHGWYVPGRTLRLIPEPVYDDVEPATDEQLIMFLYDRKEA